MEPLENWTQWYPIEEAKLHNGPLAFRGVYIIRALTQRGRPVFICRLGGVDEDGILYIGQSKGRNEDSRKTIAHRVDEFLKAKHSGGRSYQRARALMLKHTLDVAAVEVPFTRIDQKETDLLQQYLSTYGELPPLNNQSSSGGKLG